MSGPYRDGTAVSATGRGSIDDGSGGGGGSSGAAAVAAGSGAGYHGGSSGSSGSSSRGGGGVDNAAGPKERSVFERLQVLNFVQSSRVEV